MVKHYVNVHIYFQVLCHIIPNSFYLYLKNIYTLTNSIIPYVIFILIIFYA